MMRINSKTRKKILEYYDSGSDLDYICFITNLKKENIIEIIKKYRIGKKLNDQIVKKVKSFRKK